MLKILKKGKYRLSKSKYGGATPFSIKYNGKLNDLTIKLFYSKLFPYWSSNYAGKLAAKLHDNGDGVDFNVGETKFRLTYDKIEYLIILLEEYNKRSDL